MNAVKAANIVSSIILIVGFCAVVKFLPAVWAIDIFKMLLMGAVGWLMVKEAKKTNE